MQENMLNQFRLATNYVAVSCHPSRIQLIFSTSGRRITSLVKTTIEKLNLALLPS
jgi:hypothetical protein